LFQTLTSLQDQTISTVPRLLVVVALLMAALPWFLGRLMTYTIGLFSDFHRFLGLG
jgi:flagellar biosynthetic protein FliQ